MKTNFAYSLLKHLRDKKKEGGFTLIELLVVIIIIGILAAIALPSFLNQANRARETEATNALGAVNRNQQAYYLENNTFADALSLLDVGINEDSELYVFAIGTVNGYGDDATITADPAANKKLRGFAAASYLTTNATKQETTAILCRESAADANNDTLEVSVTGSAGALACNGGETVN
ncbi:MAG: type IV pilin-like G/H family protein [Leptolyngbyaceae cyanobacterium]